MRTGTPATVTTVGDLLRGWRKQRRVSQLELALKAGSSARHISFIETGRSRPSREMVTRLAEHLDVPVRERNALLTAAGYAPAYPETRLDDPAMSSLHATLEAVLTAHEPNPALVLDGGYDVVATNRGIGALVDGIPERLLAPPMNAIRLTLHPQGLAPRIHNFAEWREHLLERVARQAVLRSSDTLRALHEEVSAYPAPARTTSDDDPAHPGYARPYALPMRIDVRGQALSFISTVTTFNTPMDVTVSELAMETFLPADAETSQALRGLI